jgi:hypothetical protein
MSQFKKSTPSFYGRGAFSIFGIKKAPRTTKEQSGWFTNRNLIALTVYPVKEVSITLYYMEAMPLI